MRGVVPVALRAAAPVVIQAATPRRGPHRRWVAPRPAAGRRCRCPDPRCRDPRCPDPRCRRPDLRHRQRGREASPAARRHRGQPRISSDRAWALPAVPTPGGLRCPTPPVRPDPRQGLPPGHRRRGPASAAVRLPVNGRASGQRRSRLRPFGPRDRAARGLCQAPSAAFPTVRGPGSAIGRPRFLVTSAALPIALVPAAETVRAAPGLVAGPIGPGSVATGPGLETITSGTAARPGTLEIHQSGTTGPITPSTR